MSWRAKWAKQGVALCPNWMPVLGNYRALQAVAAKAKASSEPNQHVYALLAKEYYTDKKGRYEAICAQTTPYGNHLVINNCEVAEVLFEKHGSAVDKHNSMTKINAGFTMESWMYAMGSKAQRRRGKGFMSVFHGPNFGFIFEMTKKVTSQKLSKIQSFAKEGQA